MRGHSVDVVTAVPNYPLRIIDSKYRGGWVVRSEEQGVTVHRHWLRVRPAESFVDKALYEASFVLSSLPTFMRLRRRRRRCLPRSSGYHEHLDDAPRRPPDGALGSGRRVRRGFHFRGVQALRCGR